MYVPTLRAKEGELRALSKMQDFGQSSNSLLPNLIINDASIEVLNTIKRKYAGPKLLDVRDLNVDEIETLEEILKENPDNYKDFTIVYPVNILIDSTTDASYDYIRISKHHMNLFFIQWIEQNNVKLPENIIIDFEFIDDKISTSLIESVIKLINLIKSKNVIITSGAIPSNVPVKSTINYELERYEKKLFDVIQKETNSKSLTYGDYCTVCPIPFDSDSIPIPIVQLKYTLGDKYWFVRNGQRRGDYDFVAVCTEIVESVNNFDPNYSWGDNFIHEVVKNKKNKGNPSVWVSVGVSHHIQFCLDE